MTLYHPNDLCLEIENFYRSVFIFLLIISSLTLGLIVSCLPETMRAIAGNGTIPLKGIYKPSLLKWKIEPSNMGKPEQEPQLKGVTIETFLDPLRLLARRELITTLIYGGFAYAIWSMVTSSTTQLFKQHFQLNELQVGLSFLPNGKSFMCTYLHAKLKSDMI